MLLMHLHLPGSRLLPAAGDMHGEADWREPLFSDGTAHTFANQAHAEEHVADCCFCNVRRGLSSPWERQSAGGSLGTSMLGRCHAALEGP